MDKARLRENARIVRTLSGELRAAIEPRNERFEKEAYEKIRAAREKGEQVDWGNEDEQTKIDAARSSCMGRWSKPSSTSPRNWQATSIRTFDPARRAAHAIRRFTGPDQQPLHDARWARDCAPFHAANLGHLDPYGGGLTAVVDLGQATAPPGHGPGAATAAHTRTPARLSPRRRPGLR